MSDNLKNKPLYITNFGEAFCGDSLKLLEQVPDNSIDLVITSPPFALQRKKEYGNVNQDEYVDWLFQFAEPIRRILKDSGSFIIDLGGAYQKGKPIRSLYNFKVLIKFCEQGKFYLAEEFFWFNPAKLPSPIEWVNKRKIRVKDSVNTVWWFSKSTFPKTSLNDILIPYSKRMEKLLENHEKFYKAKKRPSGHDISYNFSKNNDGAIPSNLLQISNTDSNSKYLRFCNFFNIKPHPARFPVKLPEFFIKFLTEPDDIVLDIFAGSNTTGEAAEKNKRKWISFENDITYCSSSAFRFIDNVSDNEMKELYNNLLNLNNIPIRIPQTEQILLAI